MLGQPFSLANLRDTGEALYGRGWQTAMSRDLHLPVRTVKGWCDGRRLLDIREQLAALCRDRDMDDLARKIEALGPPE
jgi:hypothetical protein